MESKEARQLWINALRSGEFKQGEGSLRRANGERCCLGVACDVFARTEGRGRWMVDAGRPGMVHFIVYNEDGHPIASNSGTLPEPVQQWLGLADDSGYRNSGSSLVSDNDLFHKTFDEIADIVESEPEGLLAAA
jgi:hypothetical protein